MTRFSVSMVLLLALLPGVAQAQANGKVAINGQLLNAQQVAALEMQLGTRIEPGSYLVNYQSGCWVNMTTGRQGCGTGSGSYASRYGSGEWNAGGSWNHYSNAAGGAVGGTGEGCVYTTFGWSNC